MLTAIGYAKLAWWDCDAIDQVILGNSIFQLRCIIVGYEYYFSYVQPYLLTSQWWCVYACYYLSYFGRMVRLYIWELIIISHYKLLRCNRVGKWNFPISPGLLRCNLTILAECNFSGCIFCLLFVSMHNVAKVKEELCFETKQQTKEMKPIYTELVFKIFW